MSMHKLALTALLAGTFALTGCPEKPGTKKQDKKADAKEAKTDAKKADEKKK